MARRETTDLFAEILEVVKRHQGGARITRVSYGVGMPVDRLRRSLDRLATLGLVSADSNSEFTTYDITPRGQQFLETYWRMKGFIELIDSSGRGFR